VSEAFFDLLSPQRLTEIVDVGANLLGGPPPYASMLSSGLCRVTGFEPQAQALLKLQEKKGPKERYLPYAVGDGAAHMLNICRSSGMTSLFEPGPISLFDVFKALGEVIEQHKLQTLKLDEISEIDHLDFLKMDIQGSELAVLQGGSAKLSQAVAIQTEVSFMTLYKNQPVFGEIDLEMRRQGFIPHCFAELKRWPISPCVIDNNPGKPLNRLLEADIVYVRDFTRDEMMSDEQLKHLALIAHHCYRSFDLALRCVMLLERREAVKAGTMENYLQLLSTPLKA
jgi:FkbM family methyltransferase